MGTCCGKPAVESAKVAPSASLRLRSIIGRPIAPALGADLAEEDPVVPVVASIAVLIRVRPDAGAAPTLTAKDAQRVSRVLRNGRLADPCTVSPINISRVHPPRATCSCLPPTTR